MLAERLAADVTHQAQRHKSFRVARLYLQPHVGGEAAELRLSS